MKKDFTTIYTTGALNITGGTLETRCGFSEDKISTLHVAGGITAINGGTVQYTQNSGSQYEKGTAVIKQTDGKLVITGGKIYRNGDYPVIVNTSDNPIIDNGVKQVSAAKQLENALAFGGDIRLTSDITIAAPIEANKDAKLDLNGYVINYRLTSGDAGIIAEAGTLEIVDSSESQTGTISNNSDGASTSIFNVDGGNLKISAGYYAGNNKDIFSCSSGTIVLTGGKYADKEDNRRNYNAWLAAGYAADVDSENILSVQIATYTITYNLNGGTVAGNPTTYNVHTDTFTLPNPTKADNIFAGWVGSNGTTAERTVSVEKGSIGDREYTAKWVQIITAENVAITVGETVNPTATASTNGDGTLSYAIKEGSPTDIVSVNAATGALKVLKAGSTVVRVTASETNAYVSATKDVNITVKERLTGTVTISGTEKFGETLTANVTSTNNSGTLSYQWKRGAEAIEGANAVSYTLGTDDMGATITVVVTSSVEVGSISGTTAGSIQKADGSAAPTGLATVACTSDSNNDGKITGTTTAMEYSVDSSFTSATDCTGTEITGLTPGIYYVREKETATTKAGEYATVIIAEYVAPGTTTYKLIFDTKGGTIIPDAPGYIKIPALDTLPTPTKVNCTFGGWCTDVDATTLAVADTSLSKDTTLYAKWDDKTPQTITAADVALKVGETGQSVTVTSEVNGTLSYAIKAGAATDIVSVNSSTGALTALMAGTTTVVVTVSETDTHASNTKDVNITVSINEANVTYNVNGGTWESGFTAKAKYEVGKGLQLPTKENISKPGHTFEGWYDNEGLTGSPVYRISSVDSGDKTYWAKWTHEHGAWTYSIEGGSTLKATCGNAGCSDPKYSVALTLSAAAQTYSGNTATITVGTEEERTAWKSAGLLIPDIEYEDANGEQLVVAPTKSGSYKVKISPVGADASETNTAIVEFTISKIEPNVTAPTAKALTYTGSEQALVTAGSTDCGTLLYALGDGDFGIVIPKATNAGTYKVYYKVVGDVDVSDKDFETPITVTIGKATYSATKTIEKNILAGSELTDTQLLLPSIPENMVYGAPVYSAPITDAVVENGLISINSNSSTVVGGEYTITVPVSEESGKKANYSDYSITITLRGREECKHTSKTSVAKKDATCTEDGLEAHDYCSDCDSMLVNGEEKTYVDLLIEKKNHSWVYTAEGAKLTATCANDSSHNASLELNAKNSPYSATATYVATMDTAAWTELGITVPTIKYYKTDSKDAIVGGTEVTNRKGLATGYYYASITAGEGDAAKTAAKAFEIQMLPQDAPAESVGYTLSYKDETLIASEGYELSSSNEKLTPIKDNTVTPGSTYYVRKKSTDTLAPSAWVKIELPTRQAMPAKPEVVQPTYVDAKDGKITGLNETVEYSLDNSETWNGVSGKEITGLGVVTVLLRTKATETAFSSESITVTLTSTQKRSQDAPAAEVGYTISYTDETLIATEGYEVSSSSEAVTAIKDNAVTPGETYYVRKKETATLAPSPWTKIELPTRQAMPAAPTVVKPSYADSKDGKLTGLNETIEFSLDNGKTWTGVAGAEIKCLGVGTVLLRTKATATGFCSEAITVALVNLQNPRTVSFDLNGGKFTATGYSINSVTVESGSKISAPDFGTGNKLNKGDKISFQGWFKDKACTEAWSFDEDVVVDNITLYAGYAYEMGDDTEATTMTVSAVSNCSYTGKAISPAVTVKYAGETLVLGQDYTVAYKNNINVSPKDEAGNYVSGGINDTFNDKLPSIIVTGKGNYNSVIKLNFIIESYDLGCIDNEVEASLADAMVINPKSATTIKLTVKADGKNLGKNDYRAVLKSENGTEYTDLKVPKGESGKFTLTVEGINNYKGVITREIVLYDSSNDIILMPNASVKFDSISYAGTPLTVADIKAAVKSVKIGKTTLAAEDYEVELAKGTISSAGKYAVTLKGTDATKVAGSKLVFVTVKGVALSKAKATFETATFSGSRHMLNGMVVSITSGGQATTLTAGKDYTCDPNADVKNDIKAGTASVTIHGAGIYTGTKTFTYKILPYQMSNDDTGLKIASIANQKYQKSGAMPDVTITCGDYALTKNVDYTLSYKNNKAIGQATVIVKGKGSFKGQITNVTFNIEAGTFVEANTTLSVKDVVYNAKKPGKYTSTPALYDGNGKKLTAGKDYAKEVKYYKYSGDFDGKYDSTSILAHKGDELDTTSTPAAGDRIIVEVMEKDGGIYTGSIYGAYRVVSNDIVKAKVTLPSKEFTGKEITLTAEDFKGAVTYNKTTTLTYGTDFEVVPGSYVKNTTVGTAKVTIRGLGEYGGTKVVTFKISQKKM